MNKEQIKKLENDLWAAADNLRANTDLKATLRQTLSRKLRYPIPSQHDGGRTGVINQ